MKVNIAGSNGAKKTPWGYTNSGDWAIAQYWAGAYSTPPDVFLPQYSDGSWGYYPNVSNVSNSAANLALAGRMNTTTTRINTDFTLEQDLSFITKGLRARAMVSWDNVFVEINRGVNDLYNDPIYKWIDPETGTAINKVTEYTEDKFDPSNPIMWTTSGGEVDNNATQRNMNYQVQLDWAREFDDHNVTAMGLFSRQETATGRKPLPVASSRTAVKTGRSAAPITTPTSISLNTTALITVRRNSLPNTVLPFSIRVLLAG